MEWEGQLKDQQYLQLRKKGSEWAAIINTLGGDTAQRKNDWIFSNDLKCISPNKRICQISRLYFLASLNIVLSRL